MPRLFLLLISVLLPLPGASQVFSERLERLDNGKLVYLAWKGDSGQKKRSVLLALHGSGRSAESYGSGPKGVSFYTRQRDLALECDYLFVAVSNGRDTWGTQEGLNSISKLFDLIKQAYNIDEKWTIWASSAGGILLGRILRDMPGIVEKALGTFPVYDLSEAVKNLKSAREAWAQDSNLVNAHNPANYPEAFANIPYLIFHGKDDSAVPAEKHSLRLSQQANPLGGQVEVHLVPGGHSIDNFALYDHPTITRFLRKN